ncbi:MAG: malto-oligosyltrehalose trehalohydrolase [Desulfobulbaceae bacterium]|nr:MAG: malto-oligosyltrehalose trehalohydrolase [Desulfobulbaceae bacterium]
MALSPHNSTAPVSPQQFGASLQPDGGTLFRLWAPAARRVDLNLHLTSDNRHQIVAMSRLAGGWFSLHHQTAAAGDLYHFIIDQELHVPDPASRYQADDIHGPSVICDPDEFCWHDEAWQGRPWPEAVIYEAHVGTFSAAGTFTGLGKRLDHLVELGVTALELMPICQFPGRFNWGYDGALLFAPANQYGTPSELKELIDAAHGRGLMVFLDVVYNHFGPEGNYLYAYARDAFFTEKFKTPWGAAINFAGHHSGTVRDFYIANVLYWLEEFHVDGLRLDAVHAIFDQSHPDILEEIAATVRQGPGTGRHIHLILENEDNISRYLSRENEGRPRFFTAQWNDDFHHACHTLLTGENEGYYVDYSDHSIHHLGRCLTEGFAYQGEKSIYRDGERRGQASAHLPPLAFINFLQNHDQIGNRALGERLISLCEPADLKLVIALTLLAPSPPLLFMGEEFAARTPFYFFCNFSEPLASQVTEGRRREFDKFSQFSSPQNRSNIPDPNAAATFSESKLAWQQAWNEENHAFLSFYKKLLELRRRHIVPRLGTIVHGQATFTVLAEQTLQAWWPLADQARLTLIFNFAGQAAATAPYASHTVIYRESGEAAATWLPTEIPAKSIIWLVEKNGGAGT